MKTVRKLVIASALVAAAVTPRATSAEPQRLRVGVVGAEPFVVREGEALTGISVEVWTEVSRGASLTSELVPMSSVPEALDAVSRNEVDVVVGPISITSERAEKVRFTQPYFQSSLGILAARDDASLWARISPFFSRAFAYAVGGLFVVLLAVGALVWLFERKRNSAHFPESPVPGIANGVWFALVTMTTVGYGDRAPVTTAGRFVSGVWMIVALITASSLTAGIASTLTLASLAPARVETAEQLSGRKVAVVRGTPGVRFAQRMNARPLLVANMLEGVARVVRGEVDALVFDRPMLLHHLKRNPELDLGVSRASYVPQGYGFALPLDTTLQHTLNVALLRESESGRVRRIAEEWLGRDEQGEGG